jgi:cellulose biosynthesis protein BcsQ
MMDKISMVLADYDDLYIDNLESYIVMNHSTKYNLDVFHNQKELESYILTDPDIDILLIDLEMYLSIKEEININCVIALQKGDFPINSDLNRLNKYQNIDDLLRGVISIYESQSETTQEMFKVNDQKSTNTNEEEEHSKSIRSTNSFNSIFSTTGNYNIPSVSNSFSTGSINVSGPKKESDEKKTKVVGIYSVSGGSGKTSFAVGMSVHAAKMGKQVFYLNLENFNSTLNFFRGRVDTRAENNTKKALAGHKDFHLTRCIDDSFDVHYFLPDENYFENRFANINELVDYINLGGFYDYIIIDMDSSGVTRDLKIISICDYSICLLMPNNISRIKMRSFEKSVKLINSKMGHDILENTKFILNKFYDNDEKIEETLILKKPVEKVIEYNHNMEVGNNIDSIMSNKNLNQIIIDLLSGD